MSAGDDTRAVHEAVVSAPADALYEMLADATNAPLVFPGTVHVEHLARSDTSERLRIWAAGNGDGDARCWTSRRVLDQRRRRVMFRQDEPAAPMAAMQGQWSVAPLDPGRSRVRLDHTYRAIDDDPEGLAWIEAMVDRVSDGQLAALHRYAELGPLTGDGPASFRQSATLGCPVERAYDVVDDAVAWAELAPVTGPVVVGHPRSDMQLVELSVAVPSGEPFPLRLARVTFPGSHIRFKALGPPSPLAACTGHWRFEPTATGTEVTVDHSLLVDPAYRGDLDAPGLLTGLAEAVLTRLANLD